MALHPQIVSVLEAMAKSGLQPVETLTPSEARAQREEAARARNANPLPVGRVEERQIPGPGGDIRLRLYWPPSQEASLPIVVYFHGGGHVLGSLDTHDAIARRLCTGAGAIVASVDYRMGPENKFPAAVEDAYAALCWVHVNAGELRGDPTRIAVAGDSAGGNLAAVAALMARDAGAPGLCLQALIYPVINYAMESDSYEKYGNGFGTLTKSGMMWYRGHYLSAPEDAADWRASPIRAAQLAGVAPAVVITAECDVLHDDGKAYSQALREAGVSIEYRDYPGMIHGFFGMAPMVDGAVQAHDYISTALRKAFAS